jgi:acyl-coenzyme A thioesterase PaaI-like protein
MAHPILDATIHAVPFLNLLGVSVESALPGEVTLRLPHVVEHGAHSGEVHSACLFALGELAATLVLGIHPELTGHHQLQKCTKIKYFAPCYSDAFARVQVSDAFINHVFAQPDAQAELMVQICDMNGQLVAEVLGLFSFHPTNAPPDLVGASS